MSRGDQIARRARSLVGTAYRPRGRGTEGLDCAGLAVAALGLPASAVPQDYNGRRTSPDILATRLTGRGLEPRDNAAPGDLLLFDPGLGRLHLAITTDAGFIHADAALGRVVERPFPAPWPLTGVWRLVEPAQSEQA